MHDDTYNTHTEPDFDNIVAAIWFLQSLINGTLNAALAMSDDTVIRHLEDAADSLVKASDRLEEIEGICLVVLASDARAGGRKH